MRTTHTVRVATSGATLVARSGRKAASTPVAHNTSMPPPRSGQSSFGASAMLTSATFSPKVIAVPIRRPMPVMIRPVHSRRPRSAEKQFPTQPLAADPEANVRYYLASNKHLDSDLLELLVRDPSGSDRAAVLDFLVFLVAVRIRWSQTKRRSLLCAHLV